MDKQSGKRSSLGKISLAEARQILHARNEAERQPLLNLQLARAYLAGTDNGVNTRTCQHAIEAVPNTKLGANKGRLQRVIKGVALAPFALRVNCINVWMNRSSPSVRFILRNS